MFNIRFNGQNTTCKPNETLLECLLRSNIEVDFSCKSGVCHRCMSKCLDGELNEQATKKLPHTHRHKNYLLACQCIPISDMVVEAKTSDDNMTQCMAVSSEQDVTAMTLYFEPYRVIDYKTGQFAMLVDLAMQHEVKVCFVSDPENDAVLAVQLLAQPEWLLAASQDISQFEFYLRGPLTEQKQRPALLPPDIQLWEKLGGDSVIYAMMQRFYDLVYDDAQLAPFFERVTKERIVGKQFSFLKKHILGEDGFIGEDPHNSHNWMVINDNLFNHRMGLMRQVLQEFAISAELAAQFEAYEEQFRVDIVKSQPWPKEINGQLVDTEQYEECLLEEATVCDYCHAEIPANIMVKFHKRIGKLACKDCSATSTAME